MKLFYTPGACSLAPHIVLQELGIKFDTEQVDLKTKKTKSGGDFTKVNPKGSVPTLQLDNGEILTEGAVIMQYLADQKPDAHLIPKVGSFDRYRCQEWLNYIATELHKGFAPLWNDKTPEETRTLAKERLAKGFDYLSEKLKNKGFLMSDYTVADAYLFTILSWAPIVKIDLAKWPTLLGYVEKVKSRPGTMTALKAEGLLK